MANWSQYRQVQITDIREEELNTYVASRTTDNYADSENHSEHHLD